MSNIKVKIDNEIYKNTRQVALTNTERILDELALLMRELTGNTLEINNASKEKVALIIQGISHTIDYIQCA